jgi:hypothetical protein
LADWYRRDTLEITALLSLVLSTVVFWGVELETRLMRRREVPF